MLDRELWKFRRRKHREQRRYVARRLNWRPILGVETGMVDDTKPDEASSVERDGPGFKYVTTYSAAKRIARKANRRDR